MNNPPQQRHLLFINLTPNPLHPIHHANRAHNPRTPTHSPNPLNMIPRRPIHTPLQEQHQSQPRKHQTQYRPAISSCIRGTKCWKSVLLYDAGTDKKWQKEILLFKFWDLQNETDTQ
ncbi:hypothetical protein M7I_3697 [Glarea lozoyensis 74030]|uniref:Uncharacterized protein n=1 Tax=Glarea lozoyensis (strain ATCC 74030 / MF5533) TaxID=1104152 RepID=H0EM68_GLAL7|nr:hypothetical protein M7I_3697 [Glarea lozoyensis 74030]